MRQYTTFANAISFLLYLVNTGYCSDGVGSGSGGIDSFRYVDTEEGIVKGHVADDGDYYAFLGVPYASPPIQLNRFKAPTPPSPRSDIFDANRTVNCYFNGTGDEDCLVANIFTPLVFDGSLPVLVYIHGGAFIMGTGSTNGVSPLINESLIVVTINYRLGALGFLCLGIEEAPGNAGLKDQVAALKWIKRNIANFGGDPNQITISGMSAGGASVELLILTKMADGLFRRAIIESGSSTSVWAHDFEPIDTAVKVANILGHSVSNMTDLVEFYRNVDAAKLSIANVEDYENRLDNTFSFVPCLEKNLNTTPFLTEPPLYILSRGVYKSVPTMFLFNTIEGLFLRSEEFYTLNYADKMEERFIDFIPADLVFESDKQKQEMAEGIKFFYFANRSIHSNIKSYLNFFGDNMILHGFLDSVEHHSKNNNPVYLAELGYKGHMGSYDKFYENIDNAGHGDFIKHAILKKPIKTDADRLAVARVARLMANFVKIGNPTPQPSDILPLVCPRVQPKQVQFLYIGKELKIRYLRPDYWERKKFWDQLYGRFRRTIMPVDPNDLSKKPN